MGDRNREPGELLIDGRASLHVSLVAESSDSTDKDFTRVNLPTSPVVRIRSKKPGSLLTSMGTGGTFPSVVGGVHTCAPV
jgi:hypothetical protein